MNKKQAGIIVTLLALIVCAGILAAKVNGPLEVTDSGFSESGGLLTFNDEKNKTTADYFTNTRTEKENSDAQALANLSTMANDTKMTEAQRKEASEKYTKMALAQDYEQKIALQLKGKGFDDVICFLESEYTKARIIIKTSEKELSDKDGKVIKDVVQSVAKISNVEVELKQ